MSFGRLHALIVVIVLALFVGSSSLHGQSSNLPTQPSNGGLGLIVPVTGVADLGSSFSGALLIQSFAVQGNNIVTTGIVTGALTGNGTFRNLVLQVTLPLDVTASRAGLNTDAALAQSSCDVLHVVLGATSVNVLGSTVGLNAVAFDVAATSPSSTSVSTAPTTTAFTQSATVTATPSATATQVPINQPPQPNTPTQATVSTQPTASAQTTAQTPQSTTSSASPSPLASQLCAVNGFRDVSNPVQLAQRLNAILAILGSRQGA